MKPSSGLVLVEEMHPEAVQLPAPGGGMVLPECLPSMRLCLLVWVFFLFKYIYIF